MLQTILVSLYTPPPFGQSPYIWKQHISKRDFPYRSNNQNGPGLWNFSQRAEACEEVLHAAVEEMKKELPAATDRGEHYLENEKKIM